MTSKDCTWCRTTKPLDAFPPRQRNATSKRRTCSECIAHCQARYYEKNRDKERAKRRAYDATPRGAELKRIRAYKPDSRYRELQKMCTKRSKPCDLSLKDYAAVVSADRCHYCAGPLPKYSSGLDRKDNDIGYTLSNVVPCCQGCNRIKSNLLTYDEMVAVSDLLNRMRST